MNKVLIVDDEELICRSIKSMIKRLDLPLVGEVFTAFDGLAALQIFADETPCIVITDVRMPGMSGLELIKRIKSLASGVHFIVISGFDEFQYAKEAISLGVVEYLVKPVITEELRKVLEHTVEVIREREWKEGELRKQSSEYKLAALQRFLDRGLLSGQAGEEISQVLESEKWSFPYVFFCIGIIRWNSIGRDMMSKVSRWIEGWGESDRIMEKYHVFCSRNYNDDLVLLFNCRSKEIYADVKNFFSTIARELSGQTESRMTASVSTVMEGLGSLVILYEQAAKALLYRMVLGGGRLIEFLEVETRKEDSKLDVWPAAKLEEYILSMRPEKAEELIGRFFAGPEIGCRSVETIEKLFRSVVQSVEKAAEEGRIRLDGCNRRLFASFYSLEDMRCYLKDLIHRVIEALRGIQSEESCMTGAIRYIRENYNRNINMAMVANEVSMNYTYFSMKFKEYTGKNFTEYLTEVRMEEAKRLLANPANKVCEVAFRVGYESAKYFTRAFRSCFGVAPSEYQKDFLA